MPKHLFTLPYGTALPSPAGLPEGYPFRLDPDNVLYTIKDGAFVALTPPGPPPPPPPPFADDFTRSDRVLAGDNEWFAASGSTPQFHIVGNAVTIPTGAAPTNGQDPVLHARYDGTPGVADVTINYSFGPSGGPGYGQAVFVVCSNADFTDAIALKFDGGGGVFGLMRHRGGDAPLGGSDQFPTTTTPQNGGPVTDWTGTPTETLRLVYTEATKSVDLYQNGTLTMTVDVSGANYGSTDLPALTTMPYCGFNSVGVDIDIWDALVCA